MTPRPPSPVGQPVVPGSMLGAALLRVTSIRGFRFLVTGGVCGVTQLVLLELLARQLHPITANVIAFALSAQLNFALSQTFTWRDRREDGAPSISLVRRWATFHACIAGTAVLNMTVFAIAQFVIPHLPAAALGIAAASALNFVLNDRLTFRLSRTAGPRPGAPR